MEVIQPLLNKGRAAAFCLLVAGVQITTLVNAEARTTCDPGSNYSSFQNRASGAEQTLGQPAPFPTPAPFPHQDDDGSHFGF
jgi:hypothetical protein